MQHTAAAGESQTLHTDLPAFVRGKGTHTHSKHTGEDPLRKDFEPLAVEVGVGGRASGTPSTIGIFEGAFLP